MSPLTKMRIAKFRNNKRGTFSLIVFSFMLIVSLFANFIANDQPLLVTSHGHYYFPVLKNYPETTFGGVFETETDYKDPFVRELINSNGFILMPPIEYGYKFSLGTQVLAPPSWEHLLGTDDQGRDVAARTIYGFRLSVLFGLLLTMASSIIGIFVGALQGYLGGWFDLLMQRILEIWENLPQLLIIIIVASLIQPNLITVFLILLVFFWMKLVNYVRAEFLRARNLDYVRAARAIGINEITIIKRHILPNALVATFTFLPFILTAAITVLAELDFLNFGLPSDYPSLGELTKQGKNNLDAPWIGITAVLILSVMLSLLMFIGEALRDAFDPRKTLKVVE